MIHAPRELALLFMTTAVTISGAAAQEVACWGKSGTGYCPLPITGSPPRWVFGGSARTVQFDYFGQVTCQGYWDNAPTGAFRVIDADSDNSTLFLTTDGQVFGFGLNDRGQIPANLSSMTNVRHVACGAYSNGVIFQDGSVQCWGQPEIAAVPKNATPARAMTIAHNAALALRNDRSVIAWGINSYGEASVPADLGAVRRIEAGDWHVVALTMSGQVRCWGDNRNHQLDVPAGLSDVVEVQAQGGVSDSGRCMALKKDGSVVSWGANSYGEGTVPEGLRFRYLHAGHRHTVAITGNPDCNGDGIYDSLQIRDGDLADENLNGVPDVCELSVTGVLPPSVSTQGGAIVTIKGNNFPESPTVRIGGLTATDVTRLSATRISATSPALLPGMTSVQVNEFTLQDGIYIRPECGSDLDQNGAVDGGDMAILLLDWGPCYQTPPAAPAPEVPPLLDAQALSDAPRQR